MSHHTADQVREVIENIAGEDPAARVEGMPPNFGQWALPQISTLNTIANSIGRVYRVSDEALKDAWANARFMRNDTGIMECVEARQRSVALLDWHLEPEDSRSPLQKDLCAKLAAIVKRTPRFMQWRECLLHAIWHGNYAMQNRYAWRTIEGQLRVAVAEHRPINGDKLVFRYDDGLPDAGQVGIRVPAAHRIGDMINGRHRVEQIEPTVRGLAYFLKPWERALLTIHKHQVEDGAYESPEDAGKIHGVGVRSKIYWDWFQKQELLGFLMEYLERSAFGLELWYFPMGNKEAEQKTRQAAQERIGNGRNVILVPKPLGDDMHAYGVEHIEPGLAGAEVLEKIISEFYGHRIKRYILGQTLTSEAASTGLGSGVAEIHLGTFWDIVRYDSINLQESITTDFLSMLQLWNFPESRNVHVQFVIDLESQDSERKLTAYEKAWNMGARIKESDVMDAIGATIPTPDDSVLQNPALSGQGQGQEITGQPVRDLDAEMQRDMGQKIAEAILRSPG